MHHNGPGGEDSTQITPEKPIGIDELKQELSDLRQLPSFKKNPEVKNSINEIEQYLAEITQLLENINSDKYDESVSLSNLHERLIEKLVNLYLKKYKAEESAVICKAIYFFFGNINHRKFLFVISDFDTIMEDVREKYKAEYIKEIIRNMGQNQDSWEYEKQIVEKDIQNFLLDVADVSFYVINKLNYLYYGYSVISEWYRVKNLGEQFKSKSNESLINIQRMKSKLDENELKRLTEFYECLKEKSNEIKMYEQSILIKLENQINPDRSHWLQFSSEYKKTNSIDTCSLIRLEITKIRENSYRNMFLLSSQFHEIQEKTKQIQKIDKKEGKDETIVTSDSFVINDKSSVTGDTILDRKLALIYSKLPKTWLGSIDSDWFKFYEFLSQSLYSIENQCVLFAITLDAYCHEEFKSSTNSRDRHNFYEKEYYQLKQMLETDQAELSDLVSFLDNWKPNQDIRNLTQEIENLQQEMEGQINHINDLLLKPIVTTSLTVSIFSEELIINSSQSSIIINSNCDIPREPDRQAVFAPTSSLSERFMEWWCCLFPRRQERQQAREDLLKKQNIYGSVASEAESTPSTELDETDVYFFF